MKKRASTRTFNKPKNRLLPFKEPRLRFALDQVLEDPKDGLLLFGPPQDPLGLHFGVVGTPDAIARLERYTQKIKKPVPADSNVASSVMFPGFETIFRTSWNPEPRVKIKVDADRLATTTKITDPHQRVFDTVNLFAKPIERWLNEEDPEVALWFVVITEDVWKLCRPESTITRKEGVEPEHYLTHSRALDLLTEPEFFDEVNVAAEKHRYENHFHNQLKARLLACRAVTQVVRETTIAPLDFPNRVGKPKRRVQDDATIAWNLSTAIHYKAGGKPWTLADVREGVCYIGLVFKRTHNPNDPKEACCGAQMFLHTGEGIVFKGSVGPWESKNLGEFHLPMEKAMEIVKQCVDTYRNWHDEKAPTELFIHARTAFNEDEIKGFHKGAPKETSVTGIQIRRPNDLKLFREGRRPILRGLALILDNRNAFLWSSGYVPKLLTYPGREVPTPLRIRIIFGDTGLNQVLSDIMALTKLNFNTCIYGDGFPVTLRFANDVGEILTAIPEPASKPLPFRHYI